MWNSEGLKPQFAHWRNSDMFKGVIVLLSCVQLFVTPWTVAHQASLSMELSRQEYWNG